MGAAVFANKTAILYNAKQFNTNKQYSEARIVEPQRGKSAIVIMSNTAMTNYACLIVESSASGRFLRIASGTSPTNVTVRASWQKTGLLGWQETDDVAINYNPDTSTYTGYLNGEAKVTWVDSGKIVGTGDDNRSQGYLFDIDGNLLTAGVGFAKLLSYDQSVVAAPVGKVFLMWRDAWGAIP